MDRSRPQLARTHTHLARSHLHSGSLIHTWLDARSHPRLARSHPHLARSRPHSARSYPACCRKGFGGSPVEAAVRRQFISARRPSIDSRSAAFLCTHCAYTLFSHMCYNRYPPTCGFKYIVQYSTACLTVWLCRICLRHKGLINATSPRHAPPYFLANPWIINIKTT